MKRQEPKPDSRSYTPFVATPKSTEDLKQSRGDNNYVQYVKQIATYKAVVATKYVDEMNSTTLGQTDVLLRYYT